MRSARRGVPELMAVRDLEQAAVLLQPQRLRVLESLHEPDSAAGLARRLGLSRQQVNYHVRELEKVGLVELVEERRRGNCVERVVAARARGFVISPQVLGELGCGPEGMTDHFSSTYLVAVAARTIEEVASQRERADESGQRLATMILETEVRFGSAAERDAFARELSDAFARLVRKYHDADVPGGRRFRLLLGAYPSPRSEGDGDDEPAAVR